MVCRPEGLFYDQHTLVPVSLIISEWSCCHVIIHHVVQEAYVTVWSSQVAGSDCSIDQQNTGLKSLLGHFLPCKGCIYPIGNRALSINDSPLEERTRQSSD